MITHNEFWTGIDRLAAAKHISCSHMSKLCGMDATTLNKSKRTDVYGKPRWLSVWSLLRILDATNTTWTEFGEYLLDAKDSDFSKK